MTRALFSSALLISGAILCFMVIKYQQRLQYLDLQLCLVRLTML